MQSGPQNALHKTHLWGRRHRLTFAQILLVQGLQRGHGGDHGGFCFGEVLFGVLLLDGHLHLDVFANSGFDGGGFPLGGHLLALLQHLLGDAFRNQLFLFGALQQHLQVSFDAHDFVSGFPQLLQAVGKSTHVRPHLISLAAWSGEESR